MRRWWLPVTFLFALPQCTGAIPFLGELFSRALASPDGLQAKASSGGNVFCQTDENGRTDCAAYRTKNNAAKPNARPTGDLGATADAGTDEFAAPPRSGAGSPPPAWQAPMPLPPEPMP